MGYRSEVAIAIYGPEDAMVPLIAAERLKPTNIFSADSDHINYFEDEISDPLETPAHYVGITAEFEDVKWYDSYPDVQAWNTLLAEAAGVDGICTEFLRIGEDLGDIEAAYHGENCQYYLHTFTRIVSDIPEHTKYSEDNHDNSNASSA